MSDALIFVLAFTALLLIRIIAATLIFYFILQRSDRCPMCDAPTARVETNRWVRMVPSLRSSWCLHCGWEGMLRSGPLTPQPEPSELTKQV